MKKTLLSLFAGCLLASAASAKITTAYVDLENFTDFSVGGSSEEKTRPIFENELEDASRLQSIVGEDRVLELTFTDIDMAGEIEPWRNRNNADIRYVKSVYPPRMSFEYVLRDANGEEIAAGTDKISDIAFDFKVTQFGRHRSFHYEIEMLEDWARKTLPKKD